MKKIFLLFLFNISLAQVGVNTSTPHPSSALDIVSTNKGLLFPRLTNIERDAILTPTKGLILYNSVNHQPEYYYGGWNAIPNYNTFTHYVGELYGGGIVFYVYKDQFGTEHGLIASTNEQTGIFSNIDYLNIVENPNQINDGDYLSNLITTQAGHTSSAAKTCLDLTENGFSDWYLPSIYEFTFLANNFFIFNEVANLNGYTPISNDFYWCSYEANVGSGYSYLVQQHVTSITNKTSSLKFRAIRKF